MCTFSLPQQAHIVRWHQVARLSIAAVWGLCTSSFQRNAITDLGGVLTLLTAAQRTLKLTPVADGSGDPSKVTETQRDELQVNITFNTA